MATIKSFTSLEQSRKLAKILPFESADMCYLPTHIGDEHHFIASLSPYLGCTKMPDVSIEYCTPCWSLAALLSIIPQEIFDGEYIINITEGRNSKWIITYDDYDNRSYYGLSTSADNLVDACTDIIIKLKERNII